MIAIIYYQEPSTIGIISILLSLLSVATKALMFSQAVVFSVFIFNWLSLVIDFFGIFCMLSWVFYNPDNSGIITQWGYIWIYQVFAMWALCCLWCFATIGPEILTEQWNDTFRKEDITKGHKICEVIMKFFCSACFFIGCCGLALLGITIGLFSPFAFVSVEYFSLNFLFFGFALRNL